ncbi:TniQ family protein [Streptomyces lunaelactis]|uniref:TniQ family protein n=1 Tax=Streptomyces lunaelactis TaxID=1535768 RepID=UPI001585088E|nr:TniQ family protein [Streptomyces lunaelactis]NUK33590.1 TniQ family protein [Streptomyces lunaelactis]NUK39339.1 TniQ family protein [Streptomyces lunaelactis]NUK90433.1 TniQ family protein [Streptomyces lunaelactis]NUL28278.1 TniQ family protein [Streptomyces lunaelactis]
MTTRPLARSLAPLPEESLPGLLLRLAYRLDRSPARIATLCGLSRHQHRLPAEYFIDLPAEATKALEAAASLRVGEAAALTLSAIATAYQPLATLRLGGSRNMASARRTWALSLSSRYCPNCLAGDGSAIQNAYGGPWRLRWHLPVSFACTTHSRLLKQECPQCGGHPNRPSNAERQGLITQRAIAGLHPAQCRHHLASGPAGASGHSPLCAAWLDQTACVSERPESDLGMMLALQRRIDRHLTPTKPSPTTSDKYSAPEQHFFPDLIAAAQLIRLSWPDSARFAATTILADRIARHMATWTAFREGCSPGKRVRDAWAAPEDPAECGALLLAADALLGDRGQDGPALRERIQPLTVTAFTRNGAHTGAAFRRMDVSPDLARALAQRSLGFNRAGGHHHAKQRVPSRQCHFGIEHVPALLPEGWIRAHFGDLTSQWSTRDVWNPRHLRRVASLKLVAMAGGGAWPQCAEILGTPWITAQRSLTVLKRSLLPGNLWPLLDTAVETVAKGLDADTLRVDFAARRRALSTWQIPIEDLAALTAGLVRLTNVESPTTRTAATALVWARVTQGDHLHSPAIEALRKAQQSTKPVVAAIGQLQTPSNRRGARLDFLQRINDYADGLAPGLH